jgi:hypothetical protein
LWGFCFILGSDIDVNDLWNYFKNSTTDSIKKNIPTKSIGNKTTPLSGISVFASDETDDWNCLFKISAFSVGSACKTPSLLRGAILVFSFFWLFIWEYTFLGCLLNFC